MHKKIIISTSFFVYIKNIILQMMFWFINIWNDGYVKQ